MYVCMYVCMYANGTNSDKYLFGLPERVSVLEGHHPKGTTLSEALWRSLFFSEGLLRGALWQLYALNRLTPWKLKPGFINRVLVEVIFEASKCL